MRLQVPVEPNDTIQTIWAKRLAPNMISMSHSYPPFQYDHGRGMFSHDVQAAESAIKSGLDFIKETIGRYNDSIRTENINFDLKSSSKR